MADKGHGSMERAVRREIVRAILVDGEPANVVCWRYPMVSHQMVRYACSLFDSDPARMAVDARLDADLLDEIAAARKSTRDPLAGTMATLARLVTTLLAR